MKKIFFAALVLMSFVFVSCGPTVDQAIEHNDAIVADQKAVLNFREEVADLIFNYASNEEINKKHSDYSTFLATTLKKYEDMAAFDKKDVFRLAMIDFLKAYQGICDGQFKKFIELYLSDAETAPADIDAQIDALAAEIDKNENDALQAFIASQEVFSTDYGFKLVE